MRILPTFQKFPHVLSHFTTPTPWLLEVAAILVYVTLDQFCLILNFVKMEQYSTPCSSFFHSIFVCNSSPPPTCSIRHVTVFQFIYLPVNIWFLFLFCCCCCCCSFGPFQLMLSEAFLYLFWGHICVHFCWVPMPGNGITEAGYVFVRLQQTMQNLFTKVVVPVSCH